MINDSNYETKVLSKVNKLVFTNKTDVVIHGVNPGSSVSIECDVKGTPIKREWRNRLRDGDIVKAKRKGK